MRNFLLMLIVLPLTAVAGPGSKGEDCDRTPPHVVLLESADELGLDAATVESMEALFEGEMPTPEDMENASEDERHAMHEEIRGLMDDALAMLTDEQREAAEALLPPPPNHNGEKNGERKGPPPRR